MVNKIIVLGMDNTGKTTLCRELSKALGYKHVNSLGPKVSYMEMTGFINDTLESKEPMVLERFCFFEEMVYGKILRGESKFHWDDIYHQKLKAADPLIIYCRPSLEKVLDFGDREQMEGVIEKSGKLLLAFDDLYFSLAKRGFNNVITYNFETTTVQQLVDTIRERSKE